MYWKWHHFFHPESLQLLPHPFQFLIISHRLQEAGTDYSITVPLNVQNNWGGAKSIETRTNLSSRKPSFRLSYRKTFFIKKHRIKLDSCWVILGHVSGSRVMIEKIRPHSFINNLRTIFSNLRRREFDVHSYDIIYGCVQSYSSGISQEAYHIWIIWYTSLY